VTPLLPAASKQSHWRPPHRADHSQRTARDFESESTATAAGWKVVKPSHTTTSQTSVRMRFQRRS